jgi:CBS domain containing-hemolysin-like protein
MILAASGWKPIDGVLLAVIVLLLAGSGVLALAETSLVRTSRVKARSLADQHRRGSRPLVRLVERPERFLNPILLLVLVCQLVSATLVGVLAEQWFGPIGVVVGTVFEVVVIFVLFEAVPKNWAVHNPERAALFSAPLVAGLVRFPPVRAASKVLIGLANLMIGRGGKDDSTAQQVTEYELLAMADVAHAEDVIEPEERAFIHSVIDFGDTVVREVMIPRPDMVTAEAASSVSEALRGALAAGYSRIPVYRDNIDDVVGIAYAKDLMRSEHDGLDAEPVGDHMRPARFVPETKRVASMLREMQDAKFHLAIVVDEYGGTAGLVTLEDLIEELVGEIVDEFDVEEPGIERLDGGGIVVTGRMPIDDASELLGSELPEGGWDTVGGLLLASSRSLGVRTSGSPRSSTRSSAPRCRSPRPGPTPPASG